MIEDDDLLEKYNAFWDKFSILYKKQFDNEPVYNKKFLETKLKSHGNEVTDFDDKKTLKVDCNHTCLAVISSYERWELLSRIVFKRVIRNFN